MMGGSIKLKEESFKSLFYAVGAFGAYELLFNFFLIERSANTPNI
jgi:hypothetical protein